MVRTDLGDGLPSDLTTWAAVVVMGGPMSAASDDGFANRADEITLLREAVGLEVPILGVCLGAQLLALAVGGTVHAGHGLEVGWEPIELLPAAADDPILGGAPRRLTVLHWHGESYTLPADAVTLARSNIYEHQAFRFGANAWGFQFHLEVDTTAVASFAKAFADDAAHAKGGDTGLLEATPVALEALTGHRDRILDRFARLAVPA